MTLAGQVTRSYDLRAVAFKFFSRSFLRGVCFLIDFAAREQSKGKVNSR